MHDTETHPAPVAPENGHLEPNEPTPSNASTPKPSKALLRGFTTLSNALEEEEDMRAELQYAQKRAVFYTELESQEKEIKRLVASHCRLVPDQVQIPNAFEPVNGLMWLHGSFNVCVVVYLNRSGGSLPTKMAFRVPLPYKIGEEYYPGNGEEKVRSEAATYIWISRNCPDIPIPKLRGFGVPGGLSFFDPKFLPPWQRIKSYVWRFFCRLYSASTPEYVPQRRTTFLEHGYLLIDWIETENSQMLSNTFSSPHSETQTQNLYRCMAKIMISLAKIPQPRIGSWTIDNDGHISLSNRPMFCHLNQLENWAIPAGIPRNMTYKSADSLYLDLLTGHDNRLRHQGNAVFSSKDARGQATDLVLMKALLHNFTDRSLRDGPFIMQLTDMHASNIFVDEDWNINHVIDLEWACSLPLENLLPPYWLTHKGVDQIEGPEYERFKLCYEQFTDIFKQEETKTPLYHNPTFYSGITSMRRALYSPAATMKNALEDGRYWYLHALRTPKGLFNIFRTHLGSFYDKSPEGTLIPAISPFWTPGMSSFVDSKLIEFAEYRQEVHDIFNSKKSGTPYYDV